MPKIEIPTKICKHCGGIVWYVHYKKNGSSAYNCYVKRLETIRIWRTTTEAGKVYKCNMRKSASHKAAQKKYFKKPEALLKKRLNDKEYIKKSQLELGDYYVKSKIKSSFRGLLKGVSIPQDIIEAKRKELLLKLKIKSNDKN